MQQTANFNIDYTDGTDSMNLQAITGAMATSVDNALGLIVDSRQIQSFIVADSTELSALVGMNAGDIAYQQDTGGTYQYSGSAWVIVLADTGWVTPAFTNSWVSHSTIVVRYRKIGNIVYLKGQMTSGTANQPAFTLPAGFRPLEDTAFAAYGGASAPVRVTVGANGEVVAAASQPVYLNPIIFTVD